MNRITFQYNWLKEFFKLSKLIEDFSSGGREPEFGSSVEEGVEGCRGARMRDSEIKRIMKAKRTFLAVLYSGKELNNT